MNTLTIPAFSAEAAEAAQRRLDNLAKVPRTWPDRGAGGTARGDHRERMPGFPEKSVVLFAADHDIAFRA